MNPSSLRERTRSSYEQPLRSVGFPKKSSAQNFLRPMRAETVVARRSPAVRAVPVKVSTHSPEPHISQPSQEVVLQEEYSAPEGHEAIEAATLYTWQALNFTHREKSVVWFAALAAGTTVMAGLLAFLGNFIGAFTIMLVGGAIYFFAQHKPSVVQYRFLVDGLAVNNLFYAYKDLLSFNVVYEPGEVKAVIVRSKHLLTPLIHMEIGEANPVDIRDVLLHFLPEDQELEEPLADIWARRLGF